ncbi:MAG: DNA -binding domain-containing protein [Hyphomonas sp.]
MELHQTWDLGDVVRQYDYTAKLGRDRWAWEFLRRGEAFRSIARRYSSGDHVSSRPGPLPGVTLLKLRRPQPEAEAWGLVFFPDPDLDALAADAFWSAARYPRDVCVHVVHAAPDDVDEFLTLALKRCQITHLTGYDGREQFILRGAGCAQQIRAGGISLLSAEPHRMLLTIEGDECLDAKLATLKKARRVYGDHVTGPPRWSRQDRELRDALVSLDCRQAGLSYWEMAEVIHGREHVASIRSRGSRALKDAMRRNLRRGEALRDGGYRDMLLSETRRSSLAS